jgi:hypothetical protein
MTCVLKANAVGIDELKTLLRLQSILVDEEKAGLLIVTLNLKNV